MDSTTVQPTITNPVPLENHERKLTGNVGASASVSSLYKETLKDTPPINHPTLPTVLFSVTREYPKEMKISLLRFPRTFEPATDDAKSAKKNPADPKGSLESQATSFARTRRIFFDYAKCNTFKISLTLTFDPKKHPKCYDYDYSLKKISTFLKNTKRKYGNFEHLFVIEVTKDGKHHFHALLTGFTGRMHELPLSVAQKAKRTRYNWPEDEYKHFKIDAWEQSNGFADAETIMSSHHDQAVGYAAKYVAKDLESSIHGKHRKRFFASHGLKKPIKRYNENPEEIIAQGQYDLKNIEITETEWTTQYTLKKQ
jgi:hypothetical protein